jgi:hypothetical protein
MAIFDSFLTENPVVDTINNVKKFLNLDKEANQNILINAVNVPYSDELIVYDKKGSELLRLTVESEEFELSCNTSNSATPQGNRIVKGIVVNNHNIQARNAIVCCNQEKLKDWVSEIRDSITKASAYVGLFSTQAVSEITKGEEFLISMYATAQSAVVGSDIINNTFNKFKERKGDITTKYQTILENLLLDIDNGTYNVTYCGKGYRNMAARFLRTNYGFNETLKIDIDFVYCPITTTEDVRKGVNIPGWNQPIKEQPSEMQGKDISSTVLKAFSDGIKLI